MPDHLASNFSLWLEEALTGWILPVGALLLAAAAWGLYTLGLLPEGPAAAALAVVMAAVVALLMARPALSQSADPLGRGLTFGAAALSAALCLSGAIGAVLPGKPLVEAELGQTGETLALPAGLSGRVRLLVHAPLPAGGTPVVDFRLAGAEAPIEGRVERTVSYARVGRGSRAAVAHDHNETWVRGTVPAGVASLKLDRLNGQVAGPLQVALYGEVVPPWLTWVLALVAVAAAAVADSRLRKGNVAALSGMAVSYGLLVAYNATPQSAVGTSMGAVLLGGLGGALGGAVLEFLARLGPWRLDATRAVKRGRGA
jgi:hypothetical protein